MHIFSVSLRLNHPTKVAKVWEIPDFATIFALQPPYQIFASLGLTQARPDKIYVLLRVPL